MLLSVLPLCFSPPFPIPLTLFSSTSTLWGLVHTKMKPTRWGLTHTLPNKLIGVKNGGFVALCSHTQIFSFSFRSQCVSLSDRDPHEGQSSCWKWIQSRKQSSLSFRLMDKCGVRPPETLTVWLTNMQEHTHTPPCWHLHASFSSHLLSFCSLSLLLLLLYSCLTCLTASFVISNHLLFERLWQTGVLAASVWCWELGFPAE